MKQKNKKSDTAKKSSSSKSESTQEHKTSLKGSLPRIGSVKHTQDGTIEESPEAAAP